MKSRYNYSVEWINPETERKEVYQEGLSHARADELAITLKTVLSPRWFGRNAETFVTIMAKHNPDGSENESLAEIKALLDQYEYQGTMTVGDLVDRLEISDDHRILDAVDNYREAELACKRTFGRMTMDNAEDEFMRVVTKVAGGAMSNPRKGGRSMARRNIGHRTYYDFDQMNSRRPRTYYLGYWYDGNQLVGQLSDDLDALSPEIVVDPPLIDFEASSDREAVLRAKAELKPGADLEINLAKYRYLAIGSKAARANVSQANPHSGKSYAQKMSARIEADEYLELFDIDEEADDKYIPGLLENNIVFLVKREMGAGSDPAAEIGGWEILQKDESRSTDTILGTYAVGFGDDSSYKGNFMADGISTERGFILNSINIGSPKLKYFG